MHISLPKFTTTSEEELEKARKKVFLLNSLLIMNKSDYMIKFGTTSFSILLAYYLKSTVKSMTYKCVVIEWE